MNPIFEFIFLCWFYNCTQYYSQLVKVFEMCHDFCPLCQNYLTALFFFKNEFINTSVRV